MKRSTKTGIAAAVLAGFALAPLAAQAEECLQVGWKDKQGMWSYYRAHMATETGDQVHMNYEYHKGEINLKVFDKEQADGKDQVVMRGKWFEGEGGKRSGKLRLSMDRGKHNAQGWYTNGDNENGTHYSFVLRDCPKTAPPAAKKGKRR